MAPDELIDSALEGTAIERARKTQRNRLIIGPAGIGPTQLARCPDFDLRLRGRSNQRNLGTGKGVEVNSRNLYSSGIQHSSGD